MKKRILFVNCMMELGGVERSLCDVLRHMNFERYDVYLYLDSTSGPLMKQIPPEIKLIKPNMDDMYGRFAEVMKVQLKQKDFKKIAFRLLQKASEKTEFRACWLMQMLYRSYGKFDVVVAYREGPITQFAYRAFRWKKFITWWHYGEFSDTSMHYERLKELNHVVAVSEGIRDMVSKGIPAVADRICMIPNMVDVLRIQSAVQQEASPYKQQREYKHIVTVSRLSEEKQLKNIIPCAISLLENKISFVWHIVGNGPQEAEFRKLIQQSQLEKYVILEGGQANPYPYLKYADLYVHPSYVESQGLTILEAMSLGIPCVVTKSLGPCEFIRDGENALLTEQSPDDFTEKVIRILTDENLYDHIRENTACPQQFAPQQVMQQIEELLG